MYGSQTDLKSLTGEMRSDREKFIEQQKGFVVQTEERFQARAAAAAAKQRANEAKVNKKEEGEEKEREEEDLDENKVDIELVQFEREYAKILKEFEAIEAKNAD